MEWIMVHVPAYPAVVGYEVARIRRSVSTETMVAELDRRLEATGLTRLLKPEWLAAHCARFKGCVDFTRLSTPGQVYDPEDAEHAVAEAVEQARTSGEIRPYLPPQTGRFARP